MNQEDILEALDRIKNDKMRGICDICIRVKKCYTRNHLSGIVLKCPDYSINPELYDL